MIPRRGMLVVAYVWRTTPPALGVQYGAEACVALRLSGIPRKVRIIAPPHYTLEHPQRTPAPVWVVFFIVVRGQC